MSNVCQRVLKNYEHIPLQICFIFKYCVNAYIYILLTSCFSAYVIYFSTLLNCLKFELIGVTVTPTSMNLNFHYWRYSKEAFNVYDVILTIFNHLVYCVCFRVITVNLIVIAAFIVASSALSSFFIRTCGSNMNDWIIQFF